MASVKDFGSEAEEPIEPADGFSDVEDLKQHGICLPPTREDVHQLHIFLILLRCSSLLPRIRAR